MKQGRTLMNPEGLLELTCQSILDLTPEGIILASSKKEVYGCLFGRDAAITDLKLLNLCTKRARFPGLPCSKIMDISAKTLMKLISLQGEKINIASGEEPGKFLHEYRTERFEHLTKKPKNNKKPWLGPWYLYPDNTMRNYDSIDSTPLTLIAIYRHWQKSQDSKFLFDVLPAVEKGLNWIITYGDLDKDGLIEYGFGKNRKYGGLMAQTWMDSDKSLRSKNNTFPKYPIASVEPQGFAWLALKLWGDFYAEQNFVHAESSLTFAQRLISQAVKIKEEFNKKFIFKDSGFYFAAQALDGNKNKIKTITGNPLLCLWASYTHPGGRIESVVDDKYIPDFVSRVFLDDMFDPNAGIRTMSKLSPTFNPNQDSYHNGSFWPVLNGFIYEGLLNWGYTREAGILKEASLKPIYFFQTPIELYTLGKNGEYLEYISKDGQHGCRIQAWTAACILDWLTTPILEYL